MADCTQELAVKIAATAVYLVELAEAIAAEAEMIAACEEYDACIEGGEGEAKAAAPSTGQKRLLHLEKCATGTVEFLRKMQAG